MWTTIWNASKTPTRPNTCSNVFYAALAERKTIKQSRMAPTTTKKQNCGKAAGLSSISLRSSHLRAQKLFRHYGWASHQRQHPHLPEIKRVFSFTRVSYRILQLDWILIGKTIFIEFKVEKSNSTWEERDLDPCPLLSQRVASATAKAQPWGAHSTAGSLHPCGKCSFWIGTILWTLLPRK